MILTIILALLCAASLSYVLHPLMHKDVYKDGRKHGMLVLGTTALLAAGLYFTIGSPDIPSAPAFFETSGPRFEKRIMNQRELVLLEALSGAPDHVPLLLELGTLRIQAGHPQDAFELLNHASEIAPDHPDIREALGAAHYAMALQYAIQPRKDAQDMAATHFRESLSITPQAADFYQRLKKDFAAFNAALNAAGPVSP